MILAIDTCGAVGGVALADDVDATGSAVHLRQLAGKTFSEQLIEAISEVLTESASSLSELAGVVVVHGPGSFTGIRIGLSAAKGLAEALGIPIIAVSRLELLARKSSSAASIALLDAGRAEFFVGVYRPLDGGPFVCQMEGLLKREQVAALAADLGLPLVACEERVALALELPPSQVFAAPTANDALAVGIERFRQSEFDDVATLDANYLRRSETEMLARIAEHAAIRAAEASVR